MLKDIDTGLVRVSDSEVRRVSFHNTNFIMHLFHCDNVVNIS